MNRLYKVFDRNNEIELMSEIEESGFSWFDGDSVNYKKFKPSNTDVFRGFPYYLVICDDNELHWYRDDDELVDAIRFERSINK